MTAIVAYAAYDAGWLLTDTGVWDPVACVLTGRHANKVATFPHSQIVCASRGEYERMQWAHRIVARMASFDELEDLLLATVKQEWPGDDRYKMGLELVALGWSTRANRYLIAHVHAPAFTRNPACALLAPNPNWDMARVRSRFPDGPAPFGTPSNLLSAMTAQRDYLAREKLPPVGGLCVETRINPAGITQRIAHNFDAA